MDNLIAGLDPTNDKTTIEQIQLYHGIKNACVENIYALLTKAKQIDALNGVKDTIDIGVINAKSQIAALEGAVSVYRNKFVATIVQSSTFVMNVKIVKLSADAQKRITDFEKLTNMSTPKVKSIQATYDWLTNEIAASTNFDKAIGDVKGDPTSDLIVPAMATLVSLSQSSYEKLVEMLANFDIVSDVYNKTAGLPEPFSNSLPGTLNTDQISSLISDGDYETALLKVALEPEIVSNHKKFAAERATFNSGGGVPSVRDDDNDIVPWVGLFGRPTYKKSDGTSVEASSQRLKAIPSDNPEVLMRVHNTRLSFA
ncbi:hypothetical protein FI667_g2574, partial [Globisporangium splendens]